MRILQICHKPPLPAIDGGCIAMNNITQGLLQAEHNVKVLTLATHKHPFKKGILPKEYIKSTGIESIFIDTKPKPLAALNALVKKQSYNVSRFYSNEFSMLINKTILENDFDIVHLESLFTIPYLEEIRSCTKAKIILRAHNIEHRIWEMQAATNTNMPLKKMYLQSLAKTLKKYEIKQLGKIDGIATITEDDKNTFKKLGCKVPIQNIPLGIDTKEYEATASKVKSKPTVFHIGAMDWKPNKEAIDWLLSVIWHKVIKEIPTAQLVLAGKNMPKSIKEKESNSVKVIGEVKDAKVFMAENGIMVVPLTVGSGLRIKIIEGMAMGKAIVATDLAVSGVNGKNNEHYLLSNTADEIANGIVELLNNPTKAKTIGKAAQQFANEHFDNQKITGNLVSFYNQLLN